MAMEYVDHSSPQADSQHKWDEDHWPASAEPAPNE